MPLPQRQFLAPLLRSAFACAVLLLVVTACQAPQAQETATPGPALSPTDILQQASQRLANTRSVHFMLEVEGETYIDTGGNIRLQGAEGDLQRPDKVHTTFQAEVMGRTISLQLITIGEESWTTNILTGEWEPAPLEFAYRPDILFSTQDGIGPVMGRVDDVERLEDEDVQGRQTYHLRAVVDQEVVGPMTYNTIRGDPVTVDLWIDQETSDLLRARLSEPAGPERPEPAVWTLILSHHGEDVAIEPPVQE